LSHEKTIERRIKGGRRLTFLIEMSNPFRYNPPMKQYLVAFTVFAAAYAQSGSTASELILNNTDGYSPTGSCYHSQRA